MSDEIIIKNIKKASEPMQAQCRICPICYDDHTGYSECKHEDLMYVNEARERTIQRQAKEIELLEKSNNYYADKENWYLHEDNCGDKHECLNCDYGDDGNKLARQTKQELEKLRGEK